MAIVAADIVSLTKSLKRLADHGIRALKLEEIEALKTAVEDTYQEKLRLSKADSSRPE